MPRKTHSTKTKNRQTIIDPASKGVGKTDTPEAMARSLVERGLATPSILDRPWLPMHPERKG